MTVEKDATLWREPEQREREGGRAVLFVLLGLFALLAGGYAAAYFSASDKVPRGTTVASVDVGGRTPDSAAAELERMGDYAVNIAKLAQQLASEPETPILAQIPRMEQICREQLRAAMRALVDVSESGARGVAERDDELDHLYNSVYEDAMQLLAVAPERARQTTHMLFAAHHLERLGDRVTNIGEDVVFLATGQVEDLNP